ncbi:hypothetical protein KA107_01690 [Candidatus Pacearchaeota archaeon]|nr:hypothetical protein [Candidatus Pacearchaeota archaeon]
MKKDLKKILATLTQGGEVISERFDFPNSEDDLRSFHSATIRDLDSVFVDRSYHGTDMTYIHQESNKGKARTVRVELSYNHGVVLYFKSGDKDISFLKLLRDYFVTRGYVPKKRLC